MGKDENKNTYWKFITAKILIINEMGFVSGAISYDAEKTQILPTIHPSGDIYFLHYDAEGVYLYKITRCWQLSEPTIQKFFTEITKHTEEII